MEKDLYEILNVDKGADEAALKSAYRKIAMKDHPDKNPGDKEAELRFKEASAAYDTLKDPQKRVAYDRFGHAAFNGGMGGGAGGAGAGAGGFHGFGGGNASFTDIFEEVFGDVFSGGRGGGRSQAYRGNDIGTSVTITLEEAFKGKETTIKVPVQQTCDVCDGSGAKKGTSPATCDTCGGAGRVRASQGFFTVERTCSACGGAGKIIKEPCDTCHGQGRRRKEKTLEVNIPAGIDEGRRIRLSGEGESGVNGGPSGDLYVEIRVKPHRFFRREDSDLRTRVPIAITKATLGGTFEVPTIEGGRAEVKIPAGTQNGQQFRLKNKGMSILRSSSRGDMYVDIFVETPVNLNKDQEKLFKELDQSFAGKKNSPESEGFFDQAKKFWDDLTK